MEKQKESNDKTSNKTEKKNFTLSIDYSKFKNKLNNDNQDIIKKDLINNNFNNNIKEENNSNDIKINNNPSEKKNFDHFLNISGILDESQSSLMEIKINDKIDPVQKINNTNNTNNKKINQNMMNNCSEDFSLNTENEEKLLSVNFLDAIKKNNKNQKKNDCNVERKREKSYDCQKKNDLTSVNTNKKKSKYSKFVNSRNIKNDKSKNYLGNTNIKNLREKHENKSYAEMMKNSHNLIKNYSKSNKSFNLFNGANTLHNKSNFSDISYNALSTTTGDLNETAKKRNRTKNRININGNNLYSNFNRRYNDKRNFEDINKKQTFSYYNSKKDEVFRNDPKQYNNKSANKFNIHASNKNKNNNNNNNDNVINIIDNIKNKYRKQENKYRNEQRSMKNEIDILKEKLKKLSVNEALYQVEIEKLKRNKTDNINKNNNIENKDKSENPKPFEQKLDNLMQKYNDSNQNDNNNNNNNINSSSTNNNNIKKNVQLIELFNIDKDIFEGQNFMDENDNINYEEIMIKYPMLKKFIQILIKKYKNEKEYRMRLEEKTIEIFTNDIKRINYLEKKVKTYEAEKHLRVNSSLNYSYDNDLLEENIHNNFYKSCDKGS